MRSRWVAGALVFASAAALAAPASALATGTIAGTITEADTDDPLQNMCVQINVHPFGDGVSAVTNAAGSYEQTGLAPGTYKLIIGPCLPGNPGQNYITEFYDDKPTYNQGDVVTVLDGQTTTIDEQLEPGKTISGTVTLDGGGPLEGVCVSAHRGQFGDAVGSPVQTAADGTYTLTGFEPDTYRVSFSRLCNSMAPNVVTEFWNNKPDFASGDPVVLTNAEDVTDIDASLATAGAISGTVTEQAGGAPVNNYCARAQELDGDFVGPYSNTDANGDYLIRGLSTGSYKVRFTSCQNNHNLVPEYWDGKATFAAADEIVVNQGTTTMDISPTLLTGGSITGRVTSDVPGGGLAQICVYAQGDATATFQGDETDSNGDYVIGGLPTDSYKVRFDTCHDQLYRPEHYDNKATYSAANPVAVTVGTPTPGIDAELTFDNTPPQTTILSGPVGTTSATGAMFGLTADADAVSGQCRLDGGAWQGCAFSISYSGLGAGSHTFEARATDAAGNIDPTPATRTWTVDPNATTQTVEATVPPGGQATTDPGGGPSPATPVVSTVRSPVGGTVTITQNESPTQPAPNGFELFGQEIVINAPPATVAQPIQLTITIDASAIPPGTDTNTVTVVRDGVLAGDCTGSGTATPDPCVQLRAVAGGDLTLMILTSHASTWSIVRGPPVVQPAPGESAACTDAREQLEAAKKQVKKAKKALAKAKDKGNKQKIKKAKKKLKKAKKKQGKAEDAVTASCTA